MTDISASSSWACTCKPFMRVENHHGTERILTCRYRLHQSVFSYRICSGSNDFISVLSSFIWRKKTPCTSLWQSSILPAAAACSWLRICCLALKSAHLLLREAILILTETIRISKFLVQYVMFLGSSKCFLIHKTERAYSPVVGS